jgi:hypothetical protein
MRAGEASRQEVFASIQYFCSGASTRPQIRNAWWSDRLMNEAADFP